jgi:hypothetical protein
MRRESYLTFALGLLLAPFPISNDLTAKAEISRVYDCSPCWKKGNLLQGTACGARMVRYRMGEVGFATLGLRKNRIGKQASILG